VGVAARTSAWSIRQSAHRRAWCVSSCWGRISAIFATTSGRKSAKMEISPAMAEQAMVSARPGRTGIISSAGTMANAGIGDSMCRWRGNNPRCRPFQLAAFLILFLQAFACFYVLWDNRVCNSAKQIKVNHFRFVIVTQITWALVGIKTTAVFSNLSR